MRLTWEEWKAEFERIFKAKTTLGCLPEYLDSFRSWHEDNYSPESAVDAELEAMIEING